MATTDDAGRVWVFGDYRNYFQNRVTLQLIAKGKELAAKLGTEVAVVVLGEQVSQYAMEYVAHGADAVLAAEHPGLKDYLVESYTSVLAGWVSHFQPEVFIAGATSFGREFFPRLAKRLGTGFERRLRFIGNRSEKRSAYPNRAGFRRRAYRRRGDARTQAPDGHGPSRDL